eukprot:scaffold67160_cov28-Tisochrysis_lutea.AAC.3
MRGCPPSPLTYRMARGLRCGSNFSITISTPTPVSASQSARMRGRLLNPIAFTASILLACM